MGRTDIAVAGIYPAQNGTDTDVDAAIAAWLALKAAGFDNTRLSVVSPAYADSRDLQREKITKVPEGALAGIAVGAVAGCALGWLAGIGAAPFAGLGYLISSHLVSNGPAAAAIMGASLGGILAGMAGALIGHRACKYQVRRYESQIERGVLLAVQPENPQRIRRARQILERTGAQDISSPVEEPPDSIRKSNRGSPGHRLHPTGPAFG